MRNKAFRLARKASSYLGSVPSLIYAALYLAYIPVFALGYCLLPGSFYYSTPLTDPSTYRDIPRLEEEFRTGLLKQFHADHAEVPSELAKYDIDRLSFQYFRGGPEQLGSKMDFELFLPLKGEMNAVAFVRVRFHMSGSEWGGILPFDVLDQSDVPDVALDSLLSHHLQRDQNDKIVVVVIPLSYTASQILVQFEGEANGKRSNSFAHFDRMFYFSAVTLTTVGYGDIVPLTPLMRLAVCMEVILGVTTIGLFLNALANERQEAPGPPSPGADSPYGRLRDRRPIPRRPGHNASSEEN